MIGAIIGDMVCSSIEPGGMVPENKGLFEGKCRISANSVMFLAVAKSLMEYSGKSYDLVKKVRENSEAMMRSAFQDKAREMKFSRIACNIPVAYFSRNYKEVHELTFIVVPAIAGSSIEDVYAAEIEAATVFKYLHFHPTKKLRKALLPREFIFQEKTGHYLSEYGSAFANTTTFEAAIRKAAATSDPCNMAAIVGGLAEPYHGIPESFRKKALEILGPEFGNVLEQVEKKTAPRISTYIPDSKRPRKDYTIPTRFFPSRWVYFKRCIGEMVNGRI